MNHEFFRYGYAAGLRKDTRMAVLAYSLMETEIMDSTLRKLIHQAAESAAKSQEKAAHLIMARGDRP